MASLTLANFQTEVLLTLGNMSTTDPMISGGLHTRAINWAANHMVRTYPDLFPERRGSAATSAATSVGSNTIALPTNLVVVERITMNKSSSAPTLANTTEVLVAPTTLEVIGLLNKDSTTVGYPAVWARDGDTIEYHPTTRTGYTTYLIGYGIFGLADLSGASDTFAINAYWNDAIVLRAAARVAMKRGWSERYAELADAARQAESETLNIMARERAAKPATLGVAGMPR